MRRRYIDWARGLAVLVMIEAHTLDAWTRVADRSTTAFRNLTILGGFAAPLFLWLAGLTLVLSAESGLSRTGDRRSMSRQLIRRGLQIFLLAFLFRLQAMIVTPGSQPITLFRVDILNIMGPSIVAAGLLWGLVRHRATLAAAYVLLAILAGMLTPVVRQADWVGALPIWGQWYVRPAGEHTNFTMFPWVGFVFAGSVAGLLLSAVRDDQAERRAISRIAAGGIGVIGLGFFTARLPTIYESSSFWTSSPTYFAIRIGVLMVAFAAIYGLAAASHLHLTLTPLERLGRSSLFVYWIHVELVYGYLTWPIHHVLRPWQTAVACVTFCALMYGAVRMRDRVRDLWRGRASDRSPSVIST